MTNTNKIAQLPKKPIITIGINSLVSTTHAAYSNHMQLFYRLGRAYPDFDFCFVNPPRMSIDRMRNLAADTALDNGSEYLLFIDDDVLIPYPFDFLRKLIACDAPIAAADVLIRGYPFNHMLFRYNKDKTGLNQMKNVPKKLGQIPVDAVGFSVCLIRVDLLRKMNKPYFITGINNTEDIYFCVNARDKFPNLRIIADTSIQCGHILWNEVIDAINKENYKNYFEAQFPEVKKAENKDRGEAYYNLMRETFRVKYAKK
jgi:hypothetical protein